LLTQLTTNPSNCWPAGLLYFARSPPAGPTSPAIVSLSISDQPGPRVRCLLPCFLFFHRRDAPTAPLVTPFRRTGGPPRPRVDHTPLRPEIPGPPGHLLLPRTRPGWDPHVRATGRRIPAACAREHLGVRVRAPIQPSALRPW
jgi:hypothetical protein